MAALPAGNMRLMFKTVRKVSKLNSREWYPLASEKQILAGFCGMLF